MRWRALAFLCLVGAFVSIGPSSAFDYGSMGRSVGATIVSTADAYSGLTIVTCAGDALVAVACNGNSVTNKGTTGQAYRIAEDTDPEGKVATYGIDGGTAVAIDFTGWTAEKSVGSSAAFNLSLVACGVLSGCATTKTYYTNWTVEGQKANTLEFTATKVMVIVQYP